ncbi:sulfatase family protein [Dyadobacter fermentans]|uniref:Sulfatase n=1 Tax=Dyadobacter fermentans (strain ATCC 700827 / DSM 18053 / CIP 107007 / KCTC 52180 / NS114) TaxID=471854 RepID=C6VYV1_DYAFD|nr:sulfatase [Dyadobacter fermentans]ACT93456.1 sulfatase [Dyadobacter fermentans DSM 18053]
MKRILTLLITLTTTFCFGQTKKKPNILYIMSDDHTSQAWGIYGGILKDYVKNDHIEWLAANGATLGNAFCTNSICVPSRAAILTGRYSHRNGVYDLSDSLSPDSLNYAKLLKTAGYQTALIGKWHLVKEPAGFDYYCVLPGQGRYRNPIMMTKEDFREDQKGGKVYEGYSTDVITDQSIAWLEKRDKSKPFYLSTHFKATHEPFDYPKRYENYLEDVEIPYPADFADRGATGSGRTHDGWPLDLLGTRYEKGTGKEYPGHSFSLQGLDSVAARKKIYQKFVKDYIRCGAAVDDNIGRLIQYLKDAGELDNTIIIYTSDQGYFLGEHGFFDKRFIYEPSIRMPFVISYPKEIPKGKRVNDLILNIDFASLFLDYAGIAPPASMQGKSFRKNLQGKTPAHWRKDIYYRYWANEPNRPAHFGIRTDRYKLAFFYGQSRTKTARDNMKYPPGWEFYDLKNDPGEDRNAILDPQYKDIIAKLKARLKDIKKESGDGVESNPTIEELIQQNW